MKFLLILSAPLLFIRWFLDGSGYGKNGRKEEGNVYGII